MPFYLTRFAIFVLLNQYPNYDQARLRSMAREVNKVFHYYLSAGMTGEWTAPGSYGVVGTRLCCGSTRLAIYGNSWYRQNLHVIWSFPIRAWNYYDYLISWTQEHPIFKGFFYFDYAISFLEYTGTRRC